MFLGLNQGGGGMLDLEFFKKKFFSEKIFCSKIHFYQMLITFPLFFYLVHTAEGGVESFFRDFRFFTYFLNLIMHIGGPLSFRLVLVAYPGAFLWPKSPKMP